MQMWVTSVGGVPGQGRFRKESQETGRKASLWRRVWGPGQANAQPPGCFVIGQEPPSGRAVWVQRLWAPWLSDTR